MSSTSSTMSRQWSGTARHLVQVQWLIMVLPVPGPLLGHRVCRPLCVSAPPPSTHSLVFGHLGLRPLWVSCAIPPALACLSCEHLIHPFAHLTPPHPPLLFERLVRSPIGVTRMYLTPPPLGIWSTHPFGNARSPPRPHLSITPSKVWFHPTSLPRPLGNRSAHPFWYAPPVPTLSMPSTNFVWFSAPT